MLDFTIDTLLHFLNLTLFNPLFCVLYLRVLQVMGHPLDGPLFRLSAAHTAFAACVWGLRWLAARFRRGRTVNWKEEVVVVTGGASGVGCLVAEMLATKAGKVAVLDVREVESEQENVFYFQCDVSDAIQVNRVAAQIVEKLGHPTMLLNIAGIVAGKTILGLTESEIRRGVDVNLLAHFWTVKAFLPEMVRRDRGHVVTMASALAFAGCPQAAEYCAAKSALLAFHESLRYELKTRSSPFSYNAPHVRTTLLCPGGISTALFRGVYYPIPFVTPVLEPTAVADEILRALDEDCGRTVYKPFYVNLMPLMRALPVEARDLIMAVMGPNEAMRTWTGYKLKDQ
ncbi:retinal short-chain dehydrogenase/reductase [Jimgerdemannia flammicorona]|uniref:Short-chain dehydrogenase/reductase 3 n=1 Tax=Jimgerdemannia flammicorona TaxID=994334 RepID=A0A433Q9P1_9FUNG|nr:retinal short-chain dehydrogenase/reductase [Jimgerdemannia flammicorona]